MPDSPELYRQVLEYGDGYTLRSVPSRVDELMDTIAEAELVLIVAKFPLVAKNSVFDPYVNLLDIPYWRRKGCNEKKNCRTAACGSFISGYGRTTVRFTAVVILTTRRRMKSGFCGAVGTLES